MANQIEILAKEIEQLEANKALSKVNYDLQNMRIDQQLEIKRSAMALFQPKIEPPAPDEAAT